MSFFKPTLVIANRLSFFAKLSCVVIIFLVPFLWLVGNSINQQRTVIHIAEDMNQGVATLMDIKPLALELAKHRGIMAQYLGGADTLGDSLNASEAVIDRYLAELSAGMAQIPGAALLLEEIRRQWRELKIEDFQGNAAQSFTAHTLLVAKTHNLMVRVLDFYKVILQHQSEQYYLTQLVAFTLPQLQETLGQLRGRGAGALTDGLLSATERAGISGLNYGVHNALDEAKQWVLLLRQSASLSGKLEQSSQNMFTQYRDFETLVSQQLLDVGVPSVNNTDFFAAASAVINAIGEFDQVASQHFLALVEHDLAQARAHLLFTAALSVFCVLLGCYLATGILMALNASVNAVNRSAEAMTRGDFTQAINVQSRDVVGDVARNLAGMASQVSGLIGAIQHSANQVNRLSVDLQAVTDVTQAELDRQNNQTQQSASAAIEMAATVREVARNCADTSLATEVARDIAFEGRTRVMQAMNSINHLGEDVAQANTIIGQLQEDAAAIGAVLEVIGSIADQTNLLALNAAIEAARAGEQGRGFAVVADEVRSLAKRTQDSTAEIRTVIETLQGRALSAVNIIQASFVGARESVASAASAGEALDQIVNHVETLRDLNMQIASAAEQQAAVAEQMSGSSQELGIASDNIMAQVGRTLDYSVTLRQSASELLENTLRFKTL